MKFQRIYTQINNISSPVIYIYGIFAGRHTLAKHARQLYCWQLHVRRYYACQITISTSNKLKFHSERFRGILPNFCLYFGHQAVKWVSSQSFPFHTQHHSSGKDARGRNKYSQPRNLSYYCFGILSHTTPVKYRQRCTLLLDRNFGELTCCS